VSQAAATAALGVGRAYASTHLAALDRRRRFVFAALSAPGVPCALPMAAGAFYFFLRVRTRLEALTCCERLIRDHGVAVIPGSAFGDSATCSLRISYGALDDTLVEDGVRRLIAGLDAVTRA
jgi:aspartate/methionine/tyrosine aminotransferase